YLNGTDLEGSTSGTVSVEVGQQPAASDYARVYTYGENTYVDLGEIVIDSQIRTITLNYNRVVSAPPAPYNPPVVIIPVNPTPPPVVIPDEPVPQVEIPDEPVPQAETPSGSAPTVDIPDEEVPLAQVPQTSDKMAAYIAIAAVSALSLSALVLTRKLRRSEEE
ncbi:MAG: hypothetical protein IJP23_01535, partial [Oscillospiraceae bacterium]|nr:hypothetical protein [Oscillospiraceae bacterium]